MVATSTTTKAVPVKKRPGRKMERPMEVIDIINYLETALDIFDVDPADSDYQRGYQAALDDILDYINEVK